MAQELFLARGFESTTVGQIASAAGMSTRSFFRYFASKEDLVITRLEFQGESVLEALAARPLDEAPWESLRRALDGVVELVADPSRCAGLMVMRRIAESSPALYGAYLEKVEQLQARMAEILWARARERGERVSDNDPLTRALVSTVVGCVLALVHVVLTSEDPASFGTRLDEVLAAMRPACAGPARVPRRPRH